MEKITLILRTFHEACIQRLDRCRDACLLYLRLATGLFILSWSIEDGYSLGFLLGGILLISGVLTRLTSAYVLANIFLYSIYTTLAVAGRDEGYTGLIQNLLYGTFTLFFPLAFFGLKYRTSIFPMCLTLLFFGPGKYSIDHFLAWWWSDARKLQTARHLQPEPAAELSINIPPVGNTVRKLHAKSRKPTQSSL